MIQTISPGRAGIIGNPSDGYGGAVISCAIKNKATATIEPSDTLVVENRYGSRAFRSKEDFENKGDYFDLFRVVMRYFGCFNSEAKITLNTDIPEQAGLAGSTAALAALVKAFAFYYKKEYDRYHLAELIRHLEYSSLNIQCGYQDAYMSVFGGINYIDFTGKEVYRKLADEPYARIQKLSSIVDELPFLVVHSGVKHHSSLFHLPLRQRWLANDKRVVSGYREIAVLVEEGKKALLAKDWQLLAILMKENHRIQDSLSYSGEQNNHLIEVAEKNGALAAKLAGAGEGGSITALTLDPEATWEALKKAGAVKRIELDPLGAGVSAERRT